MPAFLRKMTLSLALFLFIVGTVHLLRARNSFQRDYHWTPMTQRLPLDAGAKYFEIYVGDHRLQTALQNGRIGVRSEEGWRPVAASDVTIRVNHIDRVTRSPLLVGVGSIAAALGWIAGLLFAQHAARQEKGLADSG